MTTGPVLNSGTSVASSADKTISSNKDDFLKMLVTQLENQDPMSPQDPNDFSKQMTQFGMLEQLFNVNDNLKKGLSTDTTSNRVMAAGLVGKKVSVGSNVLKITDSGIDPFKFELAGDSKAAIVTVYDGSGRPASVKNYANLEAGMHSIKFDGVDQYGNDLNNGIYKYEVKAIDEEGIPVEVKSQRDAVIDGVKFEGDTPILMIDGVAYSMDEILEIKDASSKL